MKINEYITKLDFAREAIESAPQKGFINLDLMSDIIRQVKLFLEDASPQLELGEKLAADFKTSLLKKLQTLKTAGGSVLISQTEEAIMTGSLNYAQLKSIQNEIDGALEKVFGGHTKSLNSNASLKQSYTQKHEDYH